MSYLLDTHVLIWWLERNLRLTAAQNSVLTGVRPEAPLMVSDISLLEVATLLNLGRIELSLPLRDWLEGATAPPLVRRVGITPAVAAEVATLPQSFHRDPADRVLVATARVYGADLVTSDRRIIESRIVATVC